MQESGTVKEYNEAAGTGKILRANGEVMPLLKKHFAPGLESLRPGDAITYNVVMGAMALTAKNIQIVG
ncbi:MAG: cold-shock protein [Bacteroidia bacterium]|nr:cold-shock protein [Bacteroidia bacterium]